MPVQSVTDYFPTPSISSRNLVWAEELAELIDASVVELSDVITVTTAAIAGSDGETLGMLVTVVWREP